MVASVPELTRRTFSTGVLATISSASSTSPGVAVPNDVPRAAACVTAAVISGWACPRIIGPHEQTRSTYIRPSTSVRYGPRPELMNTGVPPTAPNARTGELTPPGMTAQARPKNSPDRGAPVTRPSPRITWGSGRPSQYRPASTGSEVASICQAAEIGWAPGAGQPTRSQEQARPVPRSPSDAGDKKERLRDAVDMPALSPSEWAPPHTGQPIAAYSTAAAASRPASLRRLRRSTGATICSSPTRTLLTDDAR